MVVGGTVPDIFLFREWFCGAVSTQVQHSASNCCLRGGWWEQFVVIGVGCASRARPERSTVKETSGTVRIVMTWKRTRYDGQAQGRARCPEMGCKMSDKFEMDLLSY